MAQDSGPAVPTMTRSQAESLTERIRSNMAETWKLLADAHGGRAWEPLGYSSFAVYVDAEFGLSKGQGYRLLDQARVVGELEAASGTDLSSIVSARAAAELKPDLPAVVEAMTPVAALPKRKRRAAAEDAIAKARASRARATREPIEATAVPVPNADLLVGLDPPPPPPVAPPRTQTRDEQVHGIFERFFSSDPAAVAAMSNVAEGKARLAAARRWLDRYEMAVKGVVPYAAPERTTVTPKWKEGKK